MIDAAASDGVTVTVSAALRAVARRWYVVIAVLLVAAAVGFAAMREDGVYSVRASVRLLPPTAATAGDNRLGATSASLVNFAAAVEREVVGSDPPPAFGSPDATLAGAGVRDGVAVRLLDSGTQWASVHAEPVLTIDVVDLDERRAQERMSATLARIDRIVADRQEAAGAEPWAMVTTLVQPREPVAQYVSGNRPRALIAIAGIGLAGAVAAATTVDELALRRRSRLAPDDTGRPRVLQEH